MGKYYYLFMQVIHGTITVSIPVYNVQGYYNDNGSIPLFRTFIAYCWMLNVNKWLSCPIISVKEIGLCSLDSLVMLG